MRRSLVSVAVVLVVAFGLFGTARAADIDKLEPPATRTSYGAEAVATSFQAGSRKSDGAGGSRGSDGEESPWEACFVESLDDLSMEALREGTDRLDSMWRMSPQERARLTLLRSDDDYEDATGWVWCRGRDGVSHAQWFLRPQQPADLVPALLVTAREALVLPAPAVGVSPPENAEVLPVGLPVWFWVENFSTVSETASAPGVSVTVEGRPRSTVVRIVEPWRDGDGRSTTIECSGSGTRFDPARHGDFDSSSCSHAFTWAGEADVEITVRWELTWSATTGGSGDLGVIERSSTVVLHPVGLEAVTH